VLTAMEFSGAFGAERSLNALDFITNDFLPSQVRPTSPESTAEEQTVIPGINGVRLD